MIVYANRLTFEPEDGPRQLVEVFAKWLSSNRNVPLKLNAEQLLQPEIHIPLPNNAFIASNTRTDSDENHFRFHAVFEHADRTQPGLRWRTEIGILQSSDRYLVDCSIVLAVTDDRSHQRPIANISRPRLVDDLVNSCRPITGTPGLFNRQLTLENAAAVQQEILDPKRTTAIVLISPEEDGSYALDADRIHKQTLGMADVFVISEPGEIQGIAAHLGQGICPPPGGIRVIFEREGQSENEPSKSILLMCGNAGEVSEKYLEDKLLRVLAVRYRFSLAQRQIR